MSKRDFFDLPLDERLRPNNAKSVIRAAYQLGQLSAQQNHTDKRHLHQCYSGEYGRCALGVLLTDAELEQLRQEHSTCQSVTANEELASVLVDVLDARNVDMGWLCNVQTAHDYQRWDKLEELLE